MTPPDSIIGWVRPSKRRFRVAAEVAAIVVLVVVSGLEAADAPVAPGPESVAIDPAVVPASLAEESASLPRGSQPGPVPLSAAGQPTGASAPAALRPLPDWRLLAALGAAFAAVAAYRVVAGRKAQTLPPDVFELLGEASLGGQQSVRVVRFGPRTLLVGVSSAGCQTLAEITDPQSTDQIVSACRGTRLRGPSGGTPRGRSRGAGRQAAEDRE